MIISLKGALLQKQGLLRQPFFNRTNPAKLSYSSLIIVSILLT
ncbi:hypothetical protein [Peribacillus butanolivorans]